MTRSPIALALLLLGCGGPPPPPPPPPVAPIDPVALRMAAEVALGSLAKRKYNVAGCMGEARGVGTEAEAAAASVVNERCAVLVTRRADKTWMVVVRSPAQLGGVSATVIVSPGAEGVVHVDYKP